jgi:hypothetical protein
MWCPLASATTRSTTRPAPAATTSQLARNPGDARRHPKVALVVDDIASVSRWRVRGVEIRGEVQVEETGGTELGPRFAPQMFRITPRRVISWGVGDPTAPSGRPAS